LRQIPFTPERIQSAFAWMLFKLKTSTGKQCSSNSSLKISIQEKAQILSKGFWQDWIYTART
jgi:hypothetical protein